MSATPKTPLLESGLVKNKKGAALKRFEEYYPDFRKIKNDQPSSYVSEVWSTLTRKKISNSTRGALFELVLGTVLVRNGILPFYREASVTFVPNIKFDFVLLRDDSIPIVISAKTSLRERYKQADLEAMALQSVHRKSESYLVTLDEEASVGIGEKIREGHVLGINEVVLATSTKFDELIKKLQFNSYIESTQVEIIVSTHLIKS